MKRRTAFTLIEMLIGFGLLSFLLLIFVIIIRGGTRESTLSSDHFTSAMLSQKVMEDIMEEVDLNPYGLDALGITESSPMAPTSVVDGSAPFFQHVEDRKPPWGKIQGPGEGFIDSSVAPLYNQVNSFKIAATGKRLSPSSGAPENSFLLETGLSFSWTAKVGIGSTEEKGHLFSPTGAKPVSLSLVLDQAEIEREVADLFFHSPGVSLSQLVTDSSGDFNTILALGKIYYASRGFINSPGLKTYLDDVKTCETNALGPHASQSEEYKAKEALANAYFHVGNACFQMAYILSPEITYLKTHSDPGHLGVILVDDPENFTNGLENYLKIYRTFYVATRKARETFHQLCEIPLAKSQGPRRQLFILKRLIDLYRILAVTPDHPNGLPEYQAFLRNLKSEVENRNPYLFRFMNQELGFAVSLSSLVDKHPFLTRIQEIALNGAPVVKDIIQRNPPNTAY